MRGATFADGGLDDVGACFGGAERWAGWLAGGLEGGDLAGGALMTAGLAGAIFAGAGLTLGSVVWAKLIAGQAQKIIHPERTAKFIGIRVIKAPFSAELYARE
jgi:hypothetical protein